MAKYNDLDMKKWKEYGDVITDSLWIIEKRDGSGAHSGDYHGNFVPQIPHQLFTRYTKKGDWILDPFSGSGTSLIEARRMGRNSVGIELRKDVAEESLLRIGSEDSGAAADVIVGDSRTVDLYETAEKNKFDKFQFVIFHPPYWDIIKFSDDPKDLSNAPTLDEFLASFSEVIDNTTRLLEKNRYCALVMGDKYADSQVIPLSAYCMNLFMEKGFMLKAILVKNFGETRGKANMQNIWRYRALANDFYIFKHEYIYIFKKLK